MCTHVEAFLAVHLSDYDGRAFFRTRSKQPHSIYLVPNYSKILLTINGKLVTCKVDGIILDHRNNDGYYTIQLPQSIKKGDLEEDARWMPDLEMQTILT